MLNLEIRITGTEAVNDWNFWVYPAQVTIAEGKVYTTDTLDSKALEILQHGGNVLITAASKVSYGKEVVQQFTPVFWNTSWFKNASSSYHRYLSEPQTPVIPSVSDRISQQSAMVGTAESYSSDAIHPLSTRFQPTVQSIDTWFISRKIGMLFEANVLNGKVLMTSMDITSQPEKRIVARQMHKAILDYMNSDQFRPQFTVTPQQISELFTKTAGDIKSYTNDSPDELKPKIN